MEGCVEYAAQLEKHVPAFEFVLLPGAGHTFWAPGAPGYDVATAKLAERRITSFLTTSFGRAE